LASPTFASEPQAVSPRPNPSASDDAGYQAEKVGENLGYCDGAVWARAGYLVVADVRKDTVYRIDSTTVPKVIREKGGGVTGVAYDEPGRLYMCESVARRVSRMDAKGKIDVLAAGFEGKKFNAPNDIVVRKDGHIWFTDPAFGSEIDRRELDFNGIFHISPKGDLDAAVKWQTRPNGLALSPDGKVLYVADSDRHAIVAFDIGRNGELASPRDVIKDVSGVPGGVRTDVEGRIYIAALGVGIYTPQGKRERILIETTRAVNLAFGENDFKSLFITARSSLYRVKIGVAGALPY
jgi:gluconolactonase